MQYKNLGTAQLIDKCATQDALAWAEFVSRFSPLIMFSIKKALSRYCPGANKAEEIKDIRQNVLISLWGNNKLYEIKNRENIDYWLAVTARNATVNHLKKRQKEVLISDESYFERLPAENATKGGDEIEEINKKIKKYYDLLTPREKIIFKLYFKKELSLKDISKMLGVPLGTVSSAIARMRQKMKK